MRTKFTTEESIKIAKKEIKELIADGTFPKTISSFDELHNYCDANELGGLCDESLMDTLEDDEFFSFGDIVHSELDYWIKNSMK
jgi:hypothetical protein